ncbi:Cuticular protein glycine-rich 20, partial [Operophtera brumata]
MPPLLQCIALALVASVTAEPPSGYNYNRPSSGGHSGGFSGGVSGGGGGYQAVSSGYQTSEGQNVDAQLLEQVRQILLKEEASSGSGSGF